MLIAIIGATILLSAAGYAVDRLQRRGGLPNDQYYALFYGRRVTPFRHAGLFSREAQRTAPGGLLAPVFRV